jgi:hypothetical protein
MRDAVELVIDAAAAARLTRLVVSDFGPPPWARLRDGARRRLRASRFAAWDEALDCGWCTGVYVAAGVMLARRVAPRGWAPVARGLACAEVAGALLAHE